MLILGLLVAGAIGAPTRYLVDGFVERRTAGDQPYGTLVINISGSFILGFLTGLVLYHAFPANSRIVLGTGFCGAYTTFSTFAYDTVRLAEEGERRDAIRYLLASLFLPALAATAGLIMAML